jgi:hypothetical protein
VVSGIDAFLSPSAALGELAEGFGLGDFGGFGTDPGVEV